MPNETISIISAAGSLFAGFGAMWAAISMMQQKNKDNKPEMGISSYYLKYYKVYSTIHCKHYITEDEQDLEAGFAIENIGKGVAKHIEIQFELDKDSLLYLFGELKKEKVIAGYNVTSTYVEITYNNGGTYHSLFLPFTDKIKDSYMLSNCNDRMAMYCPLRSNYYGLIYRLSELYAKTKKGHLYGESIFLVQVIYMDLYNKMHMNKFKMLAYDRASNKNTGERFLLVVPEESPTNHKDIFELMLLEPEP